MAETTCARPHSTSLALNRFPYGVTVLYRRGNVDIAAYSIGPTNLLLASDFMLQSVMGIGSRRKTLLGLWRHRVTEDSHV